MERPVIALKSKSKPNYYLLPTPDGMNMIMKLQGSVWRFEEGACTWEAMRNNYLYEPLYELVVD